MSRDYTKYRLEGKTRGKRATVLAAVKLYVQNERKKNSKISFPMLKQAFPDSSGQPETFNIGVLSLKQDYEDWSNRFNTKEPIYLDDGTEVFVSSQWSINNMPSFIENAKRHGIVIVPILGTGKQN